MSKLVKNRSLRPWAVSLASVLLVFGCLVTTGRAQQPEDEHAAHSAHAADSASDEASLTQQLQQLQNKVAQLEAALKQNHQGMASPAVASGGMGGQGIAMMDDDLGGMGAMQSGQGMQGKGMMEGGMGGMRSMKSGQGMSGMGMMSQRGMMSGMGAMSGQGMTGMGMDGMSGMGMGGMSMMGQMSGMGSMQMPSALPGFPGASHIYHIGATGFFLDHPQHITVTGEQQAALNRIKQQALLDQSTIDRWIDQGEQEIWVLSSSDTPDLNQIEAKVRETEKLQGDKRIAFIRAVGQAAQVLTDEQRRVLVGTLPLGQATNGGPSQH